MLVDIKIDPKTLDADLSFDLVNFKDQTSYKNAIAIITMVAGDYSLDPEFEIEDLQEMVEKGVEMTHKTLIITISEEGIEAEYSK